MPIEKPSQDPWQPTVIFHFKMQILNQTVQILKLASFRRESTISKSNTNKAKSTDSLDNQAGFFNFFLCVQELGTDRTRLGRA
jgi:hypothetical protein